MRNSVKEIFDSKYKNLILFLDFYLKILKNDIFIIDEKKYLLNNINKVFKKKEFDILQSYFPYSIISKNLDKSEETQKYINNLILNNIKDLDFLEKQYILDINNKIKNLKKEKDEKIDKNFENLNKKLSNISKIIDLK